MITHQRAQRLARNTECRRSIIVVDVRRFGLWWRWAVGWVPAVRVPSTVLEYYAVRLQPSTLQATQGWTLCEGRARRRALTAVRILRQADRNGVAIYGRLRVHA